MDEIRKILVALAFSKHSKGIFNYAAKLAKCINAELIVASIINERDIAAVGRIVSLGYEVNGNHYIEDIKKERRSLLEEYVKESDFPMEKIKTIFKVGNPFHELLKISVKEEVDMIVMGPKGRTDLSHVFIGSVAEKIFRRSPVTVVIYKDEEIAQRLKKRIHLKE